MMGRWPSESEQDITRLFPDAPKVMVIEEKYHLAQNSANLRMETNQGV